jgi:MYXO-CTERM domain-containing protein
MHVARASLWGARVRGSGRREEERRAKYARAESLVRSLLYASAMKHALPFARPISTLAVGLLALTAAPRFAHAGISACGNIDIDASASCKLVTQSQCTTQCAPASFEQCCAAKLEVQCNSQCNTTADATCVSSCESSCSTTCTPTVDCTTDCNSRCESGCSSSCTTSGNTTDCQASCGACCDDHCDTQCTTVPASADCTTKCNASCTGSCTAQANTTCQTQCQESSYEQCKTDFQQTCSTQCTQTEGALFCDGNYVDVGGNLTACVDALNAVLTSHIEVSVTGSGSSSCTGNTCTGEGTTNAKVSCAASSGPAPTGPLSALGVMFGLAVAGVRRRTKR